MNTLRWMRSTMLMLMPWGPCCGTLKEMRNKNNDTNATTPAQSGWRSSDSDGHMRGTPRRNRPCDGCIANSKVNVMFVAGSIVQRHDYCSKLRAAEMRHVAASGRSRVARSLRSSGQVRVRAKDLSEQSPARRTNSRPAKFLPNELLQNTNTAHDFAE